MAGIGRGFVSPTGTDYAEAVPTAAELDLEFVELLADGVNDRERIAEEANEVATLAEVHEVGLVVHLPTDVDVAAPHEHVRDGALLELKAVLDAAETVDARRAVLHPPAGPDRSGRHGGPGATGGRSTEDRDGGASDRRRKRVVAAVRALDRYADDRGVDLCVRPRFEGGDVRGVLGRLFEATDADVCLDTGLAALAGFEETDQAALLLERGDRIPHVHCNDVRSATGRYGLHGGPATGLPFGAGSVEFDRLLDPVREEWTGTLALSVATDDREYLEESVRRLDRIL
ncbi:hypothetical protein BRD00_08165 [Halobacteriales archaeon QS_8_69_26]|nr:MAG: hypothetical protein BRD00_08165 [Halobacteriales archaeon QS_8_69_26]